MTKEHIFAINLPANALVARRRELRVIEGHAVYVEWPIQAYETEPHWSAGIAPILWRSYPYV